MLTQAVLQVSRTYLHPAAKHPSSVLPFLFSFLFPETKYLFCFFIHLFACRLHWPLLLRAGFLVAVHRLWALASVQGLIACGSQALGCAGFSNCGMWAQLPLSTQNLSDQDQDPCPPALLGGFLSTVSVCSQIFLAII